MRAQATNFKYQMVPIWYEGIMAAGQSINIQKKEQQDNEHIILVDMISAR